MTSAPHGVEIASEQTYDLRQQVLGSSSSNDWSYRSARSLGLQAKHFFALIVMKTDLNWICVYANSGIPKGYAMPGLEEHVFSVQVLRLLMWWIFVVRAWKPYSKLFFVPAPLLLLANKS